VVFAHERLDVYRWAIRFVAWGGFLAKSLPAGDPARSQLERSSVSIPLNIAEANAKSSKRDRARYLQTALGSTFECAAVLDVLAARGLRDESEVEVGKESLERITAMLMAMLKGLGRKVVE
jgi:four helix bundle protein